MRAWFVVVVAVGLVSPLSAQTDKEKQDKFNILINNNEALLSNMNEKCAGEWPTDFNMQKYCRESQSEAYNKMIVLWPEAFPKIRQAGADCLLDWSDDLLFDWAMIHYCVDRQFTAWKSLQ